MPAAPTAIKTGSRKCKGGLQALCNNSCGAQHAQSSAWLGRLAKGPRFLLALCCSAMKQEVLQR